ncbi:MAG: MFS transporter [Actinomycetaceae bacterium]|nr:MFS transporter [Actinomycetaceae bacterium]
MTTAARSPWVSFAVLMAGGFITLLDVSILNVSIPAISRTLDMGPSGVQAIMAGYSLVFGLVLVAAGRAGDAYGRRRVFLIGLALFGLASIGCGLAQTALALICLRLLQGVGAAIVNPQMLGLTQQLFTGAQRARAFGFLGLAIGIATSIGPTLGGILIAIFGPEGGWRAAFLVNVPIIAVVLPLGYRLLPDHPGRAGTLGLDVPGIVLMAGGVIAVMVPFVLASDHTRGLSGAPWWTLLLAAALIAAFVLHERRAEGRGHSVIAPAALLHTPSFTLGTAIQAFYAAGFTAFFVIYTLYLQQGIGLAAWQAGLMQIPVALGSALTAPIAGRLVARIGRPLVAAGVTTVTASALAMVLIAHTLDGTLLVTAIALAAAVLGIGSGLAMTPNQALAIEDVPISTGSTAGGLFQTLQRVGSAIGMAAVTLAFYTPLSASDLAGPAGADYPAFASAFGWGMGMIALFTACSLALALTDAARTRPNA